MTERIDSNDKKITSRSRGRPRFDAVDSNAANKFRIIAKSISLDRRDLEPLWVQLKRQIEDAIVAGALPAESRLPSEQAMCDMFAMSRPVIRAALAALTAEGRVIKQARRGMFIAPQPREIRFMTSAIGVFDDLLARGIDVAVKTFRFGLYRANEHERQVFNLAQGFEVIRAHRVYFMDGKPMSYTEISLPAHRLPGMEQLDMDNRSIFAVMREKYGLTAIRADRWLKACVASETVAEHMGIAEGTPLLQIDSIAYDHDGNALECYHACYDSEVAPIHISAGTVDVRGCDKPSR